MSEFAAGQCMFPFHALAVIGHGRFELLLVVVLLFYKASMM